jgi:hypothetical protein
MVLYRKITIFVQYSCLGRSLQYCANLEVKLYNKKINLRATQLYKIQYVGGGDGAGRWREGGGREVRKEGGFSIYDLESSMKIQDLFLAFFTFKFSKNIHRLLSKKSNAPF